MALYLHDDLNKLINKEVEKVPNSSPSSDNPFPGHLDKVFDLIIRKLKDTHDWLYTCIYNLRKIFKVAETNAPQFGTSVIPWAMVKVATVRTRHQIERPRDYHKTDVYIEPNMVTVRELKRRNGG